MTTYESSAKMAQYIEAEWGDAIRDSLPPTTGLDHHPFGLHAATFYREAARLVSKFLPDNGVLVDIGCGLGRFAYEIGSLKPSATIHLYDSSHEFTCFLRSVKGQDNCPPKILVSTTRISDVHEIPIPALLMDKFGVYKTHAGIVYDNFPQLSCDVVSAFNVYDRVPHGERDAFLDSLKKTTRKGGVLVLSTPYDFKPDDIPDTYDLKSLDIGHVIHEATIAYRMRTSPNYLHDYWTHLVAWRV